MPRGVPNSPRAVAAAVPAAPDNPSVRPDLFLDFLKLVYRHDKTPADLVSRAGELHDEYLKWASRKAPQ